VTVTVAIPVLNGAGTLRAVFDALGAQRLDDDVELLVCDSGSTDGSRELAVQHGARVVEIPAAAFSHGGTRNLLMEEARGTHVAFLTQDSVPAGDSWLGELLRGFTLAPDVALTFGPYRAGAGAPVRVRRELDSWFESFAPDGEPRVDRLEPAERNIAPRELFGARSFFTDANGCVAREAWERVAFRAIPYAEDHQLALDMLSSGYAKAYMPRAAVVHWHEYTLRQELRRSFDEWRAIGEIYGYVEPLRGGALRRRVIGPARDDARMMRAEGRAGPRLAAAACNGIAHHLARFAGAVLGTRAARLPSGVRRRLSLEGRG
jgi:glycosyltransferase involved in cell wall biosynthesis